MQGTPAIRTCLTVGVDLASQNKTTAVCMLRWFSDTVEIAELRETIGEEGSAVGEPDAISTHAQLLAEKRIGFLLLTIGLVLYLSGLVLKSSEDLTVMLPVAGGVVIAGLVASLVFTRLVGNRVREQVRRASENNDADALPEQ